jgi:high-affinity iron transporter
VVLSGVAVGLAATVLVGVAALRLQARLPYKKMLIATGIMIGVVLLTMVGHTIHVMQIIGWVGITPIGTLTMPAWLELWIGVYATWESILWQAAAVFVVGSYVLAERLRKRRVRAPAAAQMAR